MSTAAPVVNNGTAAPAAGSQEAVNAFPTEDAAAESLLDYNPQEAVDAGAGAPEAAAGEPHEKAPVEEKTPEQIAAETAAKTPEQLAAEAAAAKPDPWAIDPKLLEAGLAHPELGALVKMMQGQLAEAAKWREHFATVEEAQGFRELAPGGIEELKGKVQAGVEARAENAEFASGDPARQAAALQSIAADMPEAFAAGVKPYLDTLKTVNPAAFTEVGLGLAKEALEADGVPALLGPIRAALQAGDNITPEQERAAGEALAQLIGWADKAGFTEGTAPAGKAKPATQQLSPEIQKALDENKRYREAEHQQIVETFNGWHKGNEKAYRDAIDPEIAPLVDAAVPKNMPAVARKELAARLSREIYDGIDEQLKADVDLGERLYQVTFGMTPAQIRAAGQGRSSARDPWRVAGEQTGKQILNLNLGRAKQLLRTVAPKVLNPFAEATVAANNARVEKENSNGARVEVNAGAPAAAVRKSKLTPKDVRGMSDEAILEL